MNTDEFRLLASKIHDNFLYNKSIYKGMKSKIIITCKEHGDFITIAGNHLCGSGGCKKCELQNRRLKHFENFLSVAKKKYDYSYKKSNYINLKTPMVITCPVHGDFEQTPEEHLVKGCPKCKRKISLETIIEDTDKIQEIKYNFDKSVFKSLNKKIIVTCPVHGDFEQTPKSLLSGRGCQKCYKEKKLKQEKLEFIKKANIIHNFKYRYKFTTYDYINLKTPIVITCSVHGDFEQTPNNHLNNHGCPECGKLKRIYTNEKFIELANKKHSGFYSYKKTEYTSSSKKVIVTCPVHGDFEVLAGNHLFGSGCKKCSLETFAFVKFKNKKTLLYFIKIVNYNLYKIGITTKSIKQRYREDIKNGLKIDILFEKWFNDGSEAFLEEQKILNKFKKFKYRGDKILISGNSEILNKNILKEINEN